MKEQLPFPEFSKDRYERPVEDWVCGRMSEGEACRIGPDCKGRCQATYECRPSLQVKDGETVGRYRCTRPQQYGGPCDLGPLAEGACRHAIPKCQPQRSLRSRRKAFTRYVIMLTVAVLLVLLGGAQRFDFVNPGKLSAQHSGMGFVGTDDVHVQAQGCSHCHSAAHESFDGWVSAAAQAEPGPFDFHGLTMLTESKMDSIDQNCQLCHEQKTERRRNYRFHQPNVVREQSCSACHREHMGSGPMKKPRDENCVSCHGSEDIMRASLELAKSLPAEVFDYRSDPAMLLFKAPRPEGGYTDVFHSFADGHPEFQVHRDSLSDPNPLKFNHQLHLSGNIPLVEGRALQCGDCHQPDPAGHYHLKLTYRTSCKSCHSLQFDVETPDLQLPHGDMEAVRAFLRNLPWQYEVHGTESGSLSGTEELKDYVAGKVRSLASRTGSPEHLEQMIFLGDGKKTERRESGSGALFTGCALCHETAGDDDGVPFIPTPQIPGRWLIRAEFDHAKHSVMACNECHSVADSSETGDILLPTRESCAKCHSPQGGTAHSCATCHQYHMPTTDGVHR